jgi:hypothetical protein
MASMEAPAPPDLYDVVMPAMVKYWVEQRVIEPDEDMFKYKWRLNYDLDNLKHRLDNITVDTPAVETQHYFPPTEILIEGDYIMNRFEEYLDALEPFLVGEELEDMALIRKDLEWRRKVYNTAYGCRSSNAGWEGRRLKLQKLMNLIGKDNFYAGKFPHPLPLAGQNSPWHVVVP